MEGRDGAAGVVEVPKLDGPVSDSFVSLKIPELRRSAVSAHEDLVHARL